ncbi:hypothetical protein ABIA39_001610 [Nocardia sp. GAS34]
MPLGDGRRPESERVAARLLRFEFSILREEDETIMEMVPVSNAGGCYGIGVRAFRLPLGKVRLW